MEILLVTSCYRNQDKLQPDGPLGSNAEFTYLSVVSEAVAIIVLGYGFEIVQCYATMQS